MRKSFIVLYTFQSSSFNLLSYFLLFSLFTLEHFNFTHFFSSQHFTSVPWKCSVFPSSCFVSILIYSVCIHGLAFHCEGLINVDCIFTTTCFSAAGIASCPACVCGERERRPYLLTPLRCASLPRKR